jgi:ATP-dependent exoDNAse (exonuclease V) beta subunit
VDSGPASLEFSRRFGLGARWNHPVTGKAKDDMHLHAIREELSRREEEESNRLLYVAMTRAEQHLVLTCSGNGSKPQHWAKRVVEALDLDLEAPRDELVTHITPDGVEWTLRVLCTDRAPEMPAIAAPVADAGDFELLDPPVIDGQHHTNARVTELSLFAHCPRRYFLERYTGFEGRLRNPDNASSAGISAAEVGTQVHAILSGAPVLNAEPLAITLADKFHQSALGRRVAQATRVEREFDFVMAVEGMVLSGQIDLWFEAGGELVLVDYKTDDVNAHEAHERAREHSVQLRLYALALERLTGRPPDRAYLYFVRPDKTIEVDVSPSLLEAPDLVVKQFLDAQENLDFPLSPGAHCRRCEFYRDLCPAE